MTFVDASGWFASVVPWDANYAAATDWLARSRREPLVTTDYVIDETLTLLRSRGQNAVAVALGARLFGGQAGVVYLSREDILGAWDVFRTYADKDWSFTDCTSKVVMERLGISSAFAFDHHFRQFGSVTVVP